MFWDLALTRDELAELLLSLGDLEARQRGGVGVPVGGERLEPGKLVDTVGGVLDKSRVPVAIC